MMKRFLVSLLIPFLALAFSMSAMAKTAVKHVFGVHGLSCPFCAIGIKKTFKKVKGVQSVSVSLKNGTVTVYTNPGKCFSKKEIVRLFKKSGFTYHGTSKQPKSCGKSL